MKNESVKNVFLVIADISGYTQLMVSSGLEIEHSQYIITQLIESIIQHIKIPLQISKLEGDAIFLYATKKNDQYACEEIRKEVGGKLLQFFSAFHNRLNKIKLDNQCTCGACSQIDELKLKIVAHSGEALFYQINQFNELSGKDVILIHRLLKNSVSADEYILMTDTAYSDIDFPEQLKVQEGSENYEHLGKVKTLTYHYQPS